MKQTNLKTQLLNVKMILLELVSGQFVAVRPNEVLNITGMPMSSDTLTVNVLSRDIEKTPVTKKAKKESIASNKVKSKVKVKSKRRMRIVPDTIKKPLFKELLKNKKIEIDSHNGFSSEEIGRSVFNAIYNRSKKLNLPHKASLQSRKGQKAVVVMNSTPTKIIESLLA